MKANSTKKKSLAEADVKENSFPVVAIGASAGGLEAMMELLKYLPANTGMAFIMILPNVWTILATKHILTCR